MEMWRRLTRGATCCRKRSGCSSPPLRSALRVFLPPAPPSLVRLAHVRLAVRVVACRRRRWPVSHVQAIASQRPMRPPYAPFRCLTRFARSAAHSRVGGLPVIICAGSIFNPPQSHNLPQPNAPRVGLSRAGAGGPVKRHTPAARTFGLTRRRIGGCSVCAILKATATASTTCLTARGWHAESVTRNRRHRPRDNHLDKRMSTVF